YFTGPCALVRYNFVHPECLVVPYFQAGAGLLLTDAYREQGQHMIGRWQEFLLRAEFWLHFLVTERLSLDIEGGWQPTPNAGLADRNGGLNNFGFAIGFTYLLGSK